MRKTFKEGGFIVTENIIMTESSIKFIFNNDELRKLYLAGKIHIDPNTKEYVFFKKDIEELQSKEIEKVYVSLPISGFPLDIVKKRAENYKKELQEIGYNVITPFDVCSEPDKPYSYYMGKDIEALLECDAVYLAPGWHGSKGCTAEYEVARVYNKKIII